MSAKFYHFLKVSVNLDLFRLPEMWERQTKVHAIISPGGGAGLYRNLRPSQSSTIGHQNGKIWFCSTVYDCYSAWIVSLITSHTKFQNSPQMIAFNDLKTVNNTNNLQEWNLITINLRHNFAFKICVRQVRRLLKLLLIWWRRMCTFTNCSQTINLIWFPNVD